MDSEGRQSQKRKRIAFTLPAVVFAAFFAVVSLLRKTGDAFWLTSSHYWIYPIQTIVCGVFLIWYWREYPFSVPRRIFFSIAVGLAVFVVWIAPQQIFGFDPRVDGFNPGIFSHQPPIPIYWGEVALRFARLIIVVPLVEEIFFRGFLLRYFIREEFDQVTIGSFSWLSFAIVTIGFALIHSSADWVGGLIAGALYNVVAYRSRSLTSCVLAHAITNLCLGLWIMKTHQWGFW
jgi:uncharacterized protein